MRSVRSSSRKPINANVYKKTLNGNSKSQTKIITFENMSQLRKNIR